jgi:hypothetical protein
LEKTLASKAVAEKRAKDAKTAIQKVTTVYLMTCIANTLQFQKAGESRIGGDALHMASLGCMGAKCTHDEVTPDSEEESINPSSSFMCHSTAVATNMMKSMALWLEI